MTETTIKTHRAHKEGGVVCDVVVVKNILGIRSFFILSISVHFTLPVVPAPAALGVFKLRMTLSHLVSPQTLTGPDGVIC